MNQASPTTRTGPVRGWLYLVGAAAAALMALWNLGEKLPVFSWPETSAQVLESGLYQTRRPARWCAQVLYRYQVGGRTYESSRVSSSRVEGYRCDHDEYVMLTRLRRMQPGDRITVRYDPRQPAHAVIHADGAEANDAVFGGAALILLAAGIYTIRQERKERARQKAA